MVLGDPGRGVAEEEDAILVLHAVSAGIQPPQWLPTKSRSLEPNSVTRASFVRTSCWNRPWIGRSAATIESSVRLVPVTVISSIEPARPLLSVGRSERK